MTTVSYLVLKEKQVKTKPLFDDSLTAYLAAQPTDSLLKEFNEKFRYSKETLRKFKTKSRTTH
jgi:hypothetical protein